MSDFHATEVQLPDDRPPAWANSLMKWALTTPGLQSAIGQQVAILTFEGRKSGTNYAIPVSYHRRDDIVTIVTKRVRRWWHNFESPTRVRLRLAGREFTGKAEIVSDAEDALDFMTGYLEERPIDDKAYGLDKDERTREEISRIIPGIVVIRIDVDGLGPEK